MRAIFLAAIAFTSACALNSFCADGEKYAFLVGVGTYRSDSGLNNLQYPESDMTALKAALVEAGFQDRNVRLMVKSNPDERFNPRLENIKKELGLLLDGKGPNDTVLVVFAGHGLQYRAGDSTFFCPSDANVYDPKTWLDLKDVMNRLKDCGAGGKVLIADCCRDDPRSKGLRSLPDNVEGLKNPLKLALPQSVAAIFSCGNGEFAHEEDELKSGVFTYYLIKGLKGEAASNGEVELKSLARYLERNVYDYVSAKRGASQRPAFEGDTEKPIVFARIGKVATLAVQPGLDPGANFETKFNETIALLRSAKLDEARVAFRDAHDVWPMDERPYDCETKLRMLSWGLNEIERIVADAKLPNAANPNAANPAMVSAVNPTPTLTLDLGGGEKLELVYVNPGEFKMGSDEVGIPDDEKPVHAVKISKGFYIGKYPVTVGQFRRFATAANYRTEAEQAGRGFTILKSKWDYYPGINWKNAGFEQNDLHPAVHVTWNDAQAFMKWASMQTGRTVALPSEAQWEYAARGPMNWNYPWGSRWDGKKANHADKSLGNSGMGEPTWDYSGDFDGMIFTSPVGYYANASWCGACDMAGNVWNWCQDTYDEKYYSKTGGIDPVNTAAGVAKALRGGSWYRSPRDCRSAMRNSHTQNLANANIGFRAAVLLDR